MKKSSSKTEFSNKTRNSLNPNQQIKIRTNAPTSSLKKNSFLRSATLTHTESNSIVHTKRPSIIREAEEHIDNHDITAEIESQLQNLETSKSRTSVKQLNNPLERRTTFSESIVTANGALKFVTSPEKLRRQNTIQDIQANPRKSLPLNMLKTAKETSRPLLQVSPIKEHHCGFPRNSMHSITMASNRTALLHAAQVQMNRSTNIKVVIRFRPLNEVETELMKSNVGFVCASFESNQAEIVKIKSDATGQETPFTFDRVFNPDTSQEEVFDYIGKETVDDVLTGYNGTIFTYGQSGSGKTYTMYGNELYDEENRGIIPRMISQVFDYVVNSDENTTFEFKLSILQIYKEVIYDLLTGERDLKIKENPVKGIYVDGLSEVSVGTVEDFMDHVELAQEHRIVSGTKLNQYSSRSHSILILEVSQTLKNENITKKGILNLVDLAGSEKIKKTGAVGETLEEAKKINLSLSALGNVIHALTSNGDYIPYRDSKLTRILQESLGGNYKTSLIVTCSPHSYHSEETFSSLKFAQRAKSIKNKAKINIKLSYEELQKIISSLRSELESVTNELNRIKIKGVICSDNEEDQREKCTSIVSMPGMSEVNDDITQKLFKDNKNIYHDDEPFSNMNQFKTDKCFLHKEQIENLNIKLNHMSIELKEKDEIINNLEKELKEIKKTNREMNLVTDQEQMMRNLINLYEDLNRKIQRIQTNQNYTKTLTTDYNVNFKTKLNSMVETLFKLLDEKENGDCYMDMTSNNSYRYLIENVNFLLKENFQPISLEDDVEDYESLEDEFKTKIEALFTEQNLLFHGSTTEDLTLRKIKTKYMTSLISYYFSLQLYLQSNKHMTKENKYLREQVSVLVNTLEQNLKSNQEISQSYLKILNSQETIENFRTSFLDQRGNLPSKRRLSYENNFILENANLLLEANPHKESLTGDPKETGNGIKIERTKHRKSSGKVKTFVSKKNLLILKNIQSMNKERELTGSFVNGAVEPNVTEGNTMTSKNIFVQKDNDPNESASGQHLIQDRANLFIDKSKMKINRMHTYDKKIEKKLSKLAMLRNFIVKSIKEAENNKKMFDLIKSDFNSAMTMTEQALIAKLTNDYLEVDLIKDQGIKTSGKKECLLNTITASEDSYIKVHNNDLLEVPTLCSKSSVRRKILSGEFYRENTTSLLSQTMLTAGNEKFDIENLLSTYIETGTATRKFDGIGVKYENNRLKFSFTGGLNATTRIPNKPNKIQLDNLNGDSSIKLDDSMASIN